MTMVRWIGVTLAAVMLLLGPGRGLATEDGLGIEYTIGREDVLDIAVWNNTTVSRTVPVRPDGKISLPLLNDVQAAGLTPLQLKGELTKRLSRFIARPEVSVIVREIRSFTFSVIGKVKKEGRYELRGRATVLDAIATAGGLSEFASPTRVAILRLDGATFTRIPFDYQKGVANDGTQENFFLRPGDIVVVP